jgi:hypothetical protein
MSASVLAAQGVQAEAPAAAEKVLAGQVRQFASAVGPAVAR